MSAAAKCCGPTPQAPHQRRPPGPVWRYAVHLRQPGPGVLPRLARTSDSEHPASVAAGSCKEKNIRLNGAELMVLSKAPAGRLIRAIHWSSHERK
jgi:hypothetical protein